MNRLTARKPEILAARRSTRRTTRSGPARAEHQDHEARAERILFACAKS